MSIDHIGIHQKLIENSVSHLTWHESAAAKANFKAVSQVWIEPPAWLFWLIDTPGAYMLRIMESEQLKDSSYCSYILHYSPEATSELSDIETSLVTSDKFDKETCTPKYEHNTDFHKDFIVAELGVMAPDCNRTEMIVISKNGRFEIQTDAFMDFMISAMNYYSKTHHISCLKDKENNTVLLPYSMNSMLTFFSEFDLKTSDFEETQNYKENCSAMAHYSADCTVKGTCSCNH